MRERPSCMPKVLRMGGGQRIWMIVTFTVASTRLFDTVDSVQLAEVAGTLSLPEPSRFATAETRYAPAWQKHAAHARGNTTVSEPCRREPHA